MRCKAFGRRSALCVFVIDQQGQVEIKYSVQSSLVRSPCQSETNQSTNSHMIKSSCKEEIEVEVYVPCFGINAEKVYMNNVDQCLVGGGEGAIEFVDYNKDTHCVSL
jgi:hypothetical protein